VARGFFVNRPLVMTHEVIGVAPTEIARRVDAWLAWFGIGHLTAASALQVHAGRFCIHIISGRGPVP